MASAVSVCRNAARAVLSVRRPLVAPARLVVPAAPAAAVRALSYAHDGGQGGAPWSGHGDDGGGYGSMGRSDRPRRRVVERRPGDWDCPTCGNHVFASRAVCPRCREPRPYEEGGEGSSFDGGGVGGYRQREPVQKREGDWDCPSCQFHNFASRQACYRCQAPRPHDDEGYVYGGGGGRRGRGGGGGGGGGGGSGGGFDGGGGGGWANWASGDGGGEGGGDGGGD
ncbi:unnamed protein product [Ectocarpus fasciculatus]